MVKCRSSGGPDVEASGPSDVVNPEATTNGAVLFESSEGITDPESQADLSDKEWGGSTSTPATVTNSNTPTSRVTRSRAGNSVSFFETSRPKTRHRRDCTAEKDDHRSEEDEDFEEEHSRRSTRRRVSIRDTFQEPSSSSLRRSQRRNLPLYGYSESEADSWILGGGPEALGYPTRRRSYRRINLRDEDSENERHNLTEDEEISFTRRVTRSLRNTPQTRDHSQSLPEAENTESKPHDENEEEAIENGQENNSDSDEDMYSRIKASRRCRSTRRSYSDQYTRSPQREAVDCEPVSKRLRDRTKFSYAQRSSRSRGPDEPQVSRIEEFIKSRNRRRRRRRAVSSSSSSSSDSSMDERDRRGKSSRRRGNNLMQSNASGGAGMGNIQPLEVDSSINFDSIGGLKEYIDKLKEIVIFPLIYKDFFEMRKITPGKGILFHGPPGTGKTLLARALASECSKIGGRKVAFFMRKGADILNKWVGESERQLRILFEQASAHQPSIIFFDEIDGLAPVRSAKTDQVHNSIVSTLLAELDGVKDRGDIIVIGATNRLSSVDPALRRPGRFDYEFGFSLPSKEGRRDILRLYTAQDPVSEEMLYYLTEKTVGFSGADIRLLTTEASMCALRRIYPQIYRSQNKHVLEYNSIKVEKCDWDLAINSVFRSSERSAEGTVFTGVPLAKVVVPLLEDSVSMLMREINSRFPRKSDGFLGFSPKQILIWTAEAENALDQYIIPAVFHQLEPIPVHVLSINSLSLRTMEIGLESSAVTQIISEAAKYNKPSILYIPGMDQLCSVLTESSLLAMWSLLSRISSKQIIVLATMTGTNLAVSDNADTTIGTFFNGRYIQVSPPDMERRMKFFKPLLLERALLVKVERVPKALEDLPIAPPEPLKPPSGEELKQIEKKENFILRELRIFLREIIAKLARNKKFVEFTKPVDLEEVPDYADIVTNPMDLETIMTKLDCGQYMSAKQFLEDIELIKQNALNYNPTTTDVDKRIRHRAMELYDFACRLIDNEMDSDFEDQCQGIIKAREDRDITAKNYELAKKKSENKENENLKRKSLSNNAENPKEETDAKTTNTNETDTNNASKIFAPTSSLLRPLQRKRKRVSRWSRGCVVKPKVMKLISPKLTNGVKLPLQVKTEGEDTKSMYSSQDSSKSSSEKQSTQETETKPSGQPDDLQVAKNSTRRSSSESVSSRGRTRNKSSGSFGSSGNNENDKNGRKDVKEEGNESNCTNDNSHNSGHGDSLVEEDQQMTSFEDSQSQECSNTASSNGCMDLESDMEPDVDGYVKSSKNQKLLKKLEELMFLIAEVTCSSTVDDLLSVHSQLLQVVEKHEKSHDKTDLVKELREFCCQLKLKTM